MLSTSKISHFNNRCHLFHLVKFRFWPQGARKSPIYFLLVIIQNQQKTAAHPPDLIPESSSCSNSVCVFKSAPSGEPHVFGREWMRNTPFLPELSLLRFMGIVINTLHKCLSETRRGTGHSDSRRRGKQPTAAHLSSWNWHKRCTGTFKSLVIHTCQMTWKWNQVQSPSGSFREAREGEKHGSKWPAWASWGC